MGGRCFALQGSVGELHWAFFFCQNFAGILPCTPKCLSTASGKFLCYGCRSERGPNRGTPLHRTYRRRITARGINSVRSCSKLINGHAVPIHAALTRWATFLSGENRTLAIIAEIRLLIVALVAVAAVVPLGVVPLGVVPLGVVPLVVVCLVAAPITKYSDRLIGTNRFTGTFSNQCVQGLLLVNQLVLLVQQMLLLVEKLLYHLSLLARWPLSISSRLVMLELHMPLQAWNRPKRSWRIALQTFNFIIRHHDHLRTPHVATG